ncbi:MAG: hypothetical protein MUO38_00840 [Anaerolineales bacterium]|nr:hypothetical protein [Anaerolineales bacterium]
MVTWIADWAILPALLAGVTGTLLVVLDDRRAVLGILAGQYLCAAWLVGLALPLSIAAAKLVAGLMACGALALSVAALRWRSPEVQAGALPSGHAFRLVAAGMVATVAVGLGLGNWMSLPGITAPGILGSTLLMGLGLLQIGITEEPLRVGAGLLTLLSGFEIAYSSIEPSLAVVALLAAVHLGIALVVSYLLLVVRDERPIPEGGG